MFNNSGVTRTTFGAPRQILAEVSQQKSVGCIVPQEFGVDVGQRKIAKAGTPINIDFMNLQNAAKKPADGSVAMNAVLLHDVDVTNGNANGTALYFGSVNISRVDTDVAAAIMEAIGFTGKAAPSPLLTFMKV